MFRVSHSQIINAAPVVVYGILTDYAGAHNAILPRPPFGDIHVTRGGHGAGTELDVTLEMFGKQFPFHLVVTEPEPGRVLMEADAQAEVVTRFIVEPAGEGKTHLTISSENPSSAGFKGWLESQITSMITRRIYRREMDNIDRYAQQAMKAQTA